MMNRTTSPAMKTITFTNHGIDSLSETSLMAERTRGTSLNPSLSSANSAGSFIIDAEPKQIGRRRAKGRQMREFLFDIRYERGADRFMDLLRETPKARSTALLCSMNGEALWQLARITGPQAVVDELTELLSTDSYDPFSVSDRDCDGRQYCDVLGGGARKSVVYTYLDNIGHCDAVPVIASRYVSGGLLFEVTRRDDTERWRILLPDNEKVGMLYDTLSGTLGEGLSFRFEHVGQVSESLVNPFSSVPMRPEQRRILELAAEEGYYETPRGTTLEELASKLDCPRSTVSYRLRQAEAGLVESFLD